MINTNVRGEKSRSGGLETLIVFATHALTLVATLAIQSVLARSLGADGRGEYAILVLFGTAFPVLFGAGVDRASQYFAMSGKMPMWHAIFSACLVLAAGSAIAAAVALPLIDSHIRFFDQAPEHLFVVALSLFPLTSLLTLAQLHSAGKRQFRSLAIAALAQTGSQLLCLSVLLQTLEDRTLAAVISYAASLVVASIVLFRHLAQVEPPSLVRAPNGIVPIMRYGLKYYGARVGNLVDLGMGTLLLALVADTQAVGIFAAVSAIALKILLGAESIETTILPRISADPHHRLDLIKRCFRVSMSLTLIGMGALSFLAPLVVPWLFSEAFSPGIALIWTMAPGIVVQGGAAMLMAYYRGTNQPGVCSVAVWLGMCTNAIGFAVLYPSIGLHAAGVSMTLGLIARSWFLLSAFSRSNGVGALDLVVPERADWVFVRDSVEQAFSRFARTRP